MRLGVPSLFCCGITVSFESMHEHINVFDADRARHSMIYHTHTHTHTHTFFGGVYSISSSDITLSFSSTPASLAGNSFSHSTRRLAMAFPASLFAYSSAL